MEKIHTRLLLLLPLFAAAGAGVALFDSGITMWLLGVVGVASLHPTVYALRRWVGNGEAVVLMALSLAAAIFAAFSLSTAELSSKLVFAALLPNIFFGGYAASRCLFGRAFPRGMAAIAIIFSSSIFIATAIAAIYGSESVVSLTFTSAILSAATLFAALCEIRFWLRPAILPVPVQFTLGLIATGSIAAGIAAVGFNVPATAFAVLLVGGLLLIYRGFYYRFDDMIVFVDEAGSAVGTGRKLESHTPQTRLHRAFSVCLFNEDGEVLLQQRAFSKKAWPGVWSNSCCGHVMLHETTIAAAKRRVAYELGVKRVDLKIILPDFRYRAEKDGVVENEVCPVLIGFMNGKPRPRPSEVAAVRFAPWSEVIAAVNDPASGISPWAVEEVKLLAASEIFRAEFDAKTNGGEISNPESALPLREAA